MLLKPEDAQLLIVDIQGRLMPAMEDPNRVIARSVILARAARRLGIPITASRQYPNGLGPLVPAIEEVLEEGETLDKTAFSCAADPALFDHVARYGRNQVVICGVETHVCVLQTAMGFAAQGLSSFVAVDACSSRSISDKLVAVDRMRAAGIGIVTSEMVCFEWMGDAKTESFKDISNLIK